MYRLAWDDPETFSGRKAIPSQQAFPPRGPMIGDLDTVSKYNLSCKVQDLHR
jgi:hypothetical protein